MSQFVYDIVVKEFATSLKALRSILLKAQAHAAQNKFDAEKFLDLKLAPDMLNFTKQVQIATDNIKGAAGRLSGTELPKFEDNEKTWEEIIARVDKTINYITKFKPEDFNNYAAQKISFFWNPGMYLEGHDYLTTYAIPNVYFHLTTAYALLRSSGVQIGKSDFLGEINWKK